MTNNTLKAKTKTRDYKFLASRTWGNLVKNASITIAVTMTTAVTLMLLGSAILLNVQVDKLKDYWYDKVEVSVFLCTSSSNYTTCPDGEVTDEQRKNIKETIEGLEVTDEVFFESKSQAWERFKATYDNAEVLEQVNESTMPESFRIKLKNPRAFDEVAQNIAPIRGVETVADQRKVLQRFFTVVSGLQAAALTVALIQLGVAMLLVFNTVRTTTHARRREISIMRLVGASNFMIKGPFIAHLGVAGLLGSLLACAGLASLYQFVYLDVIRTASGFASVTWSAWWWILPVLCLLGSLMPILASSFALRRYMK